MAELIWSVLCSKSLIEPQTNLLSLFEVIEKITLEGGEKKLLDAHAEGRKGILLSVQMQVVSFWRRSDPSKGETSEGRVILVNPRGETVAGQNFLINLKHNSGGYRQILRYHQFPVDSFGMYWFVAEQQRPAKSKKSQWTVETRIPVDVVAGPEAAVASSEPLPASSPPPARRPASGR
jgi:hypothetical protein